MALRSERQWWTGRILCRDASHETMEEWRRLRRGHALGEHLPPRKSHWSFLVVFFVHGLPYLESFWRRGKHLRQTCRWQIYILRVASSGLVETGIYPILKECRPRDLEKRQQKLDCLKYWTLRKSSRRSCFPRTCSGMSFCPDYLRFVGNVSTFTALTCPIVTIKFCTSCYKTNFASGPEAEVALTMNTCFILIITP